MYTLFIIKTSQYKIILITIQMINDAGNLKCTYILNGYTHHT